MEERLQKILAHAGHGSRRSCEILISEGRVTVNGELATLGQRADVERDTIEVDGQRVRAPEPSIYIALHKPRGVLSDAGDQTRQRRTVFDLVNVSGHLFPIGRLDLMSEGLVLLTNDGDLAHRLTHPRYEHNKVYRVRVEGHPDDKALRSWRRGVYLDGRKTVPAEVRVERREKGSTWLRVVLREGRKRQIRRVAAMLGYPVRRLIRVRIGPVDLGDLKPGSWRHLTPSERGALRRLLKD